MTAASMSTSVTDGLMGIEPSCVAALALLSTPLGAASRSCRAFAGSFDLREATVKIFAHVPTESPAGGRP
jgi:hypothetical protein